MNFYLLTHFNDHQIFSHLQGARVCFPRASFYVWFAIEHARRRVLDFDVTEHPLAAWVVQQLREAFPYDTAPHHLVFDRDAILSAQVVSIVESLGIRAARTAYRSPWQNGVAERWIGSVQRELHERHLRQLLRQYLAYYHHDRTHLALAKETPAGRRALAPHQAYAAVVTLPRLGGCIIATTLRRESPHRLATELVQLRKWGERMMDNHLVCRLLHRLPERAQPMTRNAVIHRLPASAAPRICRAPSVPWRRPMMAKHSRASSASS